LHSIGENRTPPEHTRHTYVRRVSRINRRCCRFPPHRCCQRSRPLLPSCCEIFQDGKPHGTTRLFPGNWRTPFGTCRCSFGTEMMDEFWLVIWHITGKKDDFGILT
jgi:hypothetical protein